MSSGSTVLVSGSDHGDSSDGTDRSGGGFHRAVEENPGLKFSGSHFPITRSFCFVPPGLFSLFRGVYTMFSLAPTFRVPTLTLTLTLILTLTPGKRSRQHHQHIQGRRVIAHKL